MTLVVRTPPDSTGDIRDVGSILGLGRSPRAGHGNPLQYSCLENPVDRGAWWATVHRVTKGQTWLKRLSTHLCTQNHYPNHDVKHFYHPRKISHSCLQLIPDLSSGLRQLLTCFYHYNFAFSRPSRKWNHIVYGFCVSGFFHLPWYFDSFMLWWFIHFNG